MEIQRHIMDGRRCWITRSRKLARQNCRLSEGKIFTFFIQPFLHPTFTPGIRRVFLYFYTCQGLELLIIMITQTLKVMNADEGIK